VSGCPSDAQAIRQKCGAIRSRRLARGRGQSANGDKALPEFVAKLARQMLPFLVLNGNQLSI
jgi:hypothetical protein